MKKRTENKEKAAASITLRPKPSEFSSPSRKPILFFIFLLCFVFRVLVKLFIHCDSTPSGP